ncbi:histidine triad nucleotide-binding protein [Inhella gelatinilytica]|uniref:Histidine triad nucleotide-binding protein n=1 Tax=Inhella gelatinilytica TaxID=2795030 RepID=A0A931NF83_9BURK|nr:histidine triad nucleotide-binding protein [Inhella gelatinilytica]MBH9553266.1 histidine triad nucleotide-binding protein [Inhella gelatinilytica]
MSHDPHCIFCKIVAGQIPSRKAYEDDELLAFHDIQPSAPVHLLIVPKVHLPSLAEARPEHQGLLGRMMVLAPELMREAGVTGGFRAQINTGADGGQEVMHLHLHVMGGPRPWRKG